MSDTPEAPDAREAPTDWRDLEIARLRRDLDTERATVATLREQVRLGDKREAMLTAELARLRDSQGRLLETARAMLGPPYPDDIRLLIVAVGGVTPSAKRALEMVESLTDRREALRAAIAAAESAPPADTSPKIETLKDATIHYPADMQGPGKWFPLVCPKCEWRGLSRDSICRATGGDDYDDPECLRCGTVLEDDEKASPPPADDLARRLDEDGVDRLAVAMKAKLAKKRAEGRGGWYDPAVCSVDDLWAMLHEHIAKDDPIDIANFAMMIYNRGLLRDTAREGR